VREERVPMMVKPTSSRSSSLGSFILGLFLTWLGVAIIIVMKPKPVQGSRNEEPET
jgi:hypothetical protein